MQNIKIIDYITILNPDKIPTKEQLDKLNDCYKKLIKLMKETDIKIITAESLNEMSIRS